MGMVFLADDTMLHEPVCVKVLHASLADHPEASERFNREIVLARRISHKGVCRLHDIYTDDSLRFITMEYVEGESLRDLLQPERPLMSVDRVVTIVASICEALGAAHDVAVVHRDLKPRNIMVRPTDEAAILDFGIATALDGMSSLTLPGIALGTRHYIAPEVWAGRPATPAADQFAVGVILYNCLTRRMPYNPTRDVLLLDEMSKGPPPPPSVHRAGVSPALDAVTLRALAFKPERRFSDVRALRDALLATRAGEAASAPPWAREAPDPVSGVHLPPTLPSIQAPPLRSTAPSPSDPIMDPLDRTLVTAWPTTTPSSADPPATGFVPSNPDGLPTSDASWVVSGRRVDLPAIPKSVEAQKAVIVRGIADMVEPDLRPPTAAAPWRLVVAILLCAAVIAGIIVVVGTAPGAPAADAGVAAALSTTPPPGEPAVPIKPAPAPATGDVAVDTAPGDDHTDTDADTTDDASDPTPGHDSAGSKRASSERPRTVPVRDDDRRRYGEQARALAAAMSARGVLPGDDEELDRLRQRAAQHARQRDYDDGRRALEDAAARVPEVAIDKSFVERKLARFNDRFDAVTNDERRRAADTQMADVMTAIAQTRYQDANDVLNRAFELLR